MLSEIILNILYTFFLYTKKNLTITKILIIVSSDSKTYKVTNYTLYKIKEISCCKSYLFYYNNIIVPVNQIICCKSVFYFYQITFVFTNSLIFPFEAILDVNEKYSCYKLKLPEFSKLNYVYDNSYCADLDKWEKNVNLKQ